MDLKILYEDNHIVVCHKPAGTPTQSNKISTPDMVSLLKNHLSRSTTFSGEPYVAVIHRLDQPVEGLLIFGKTPFAAKELNQQLQKNGFGKYYLALVCGQPPLKNDTLEHYLVKDAKTNTSCICSGDVRDAKKAILTYEILTERKSSLPNTTWIKVQLETGRHHQIRVQLAHIGCPIWGDSKYNHSYQNEIKQQQLALYAYKLIFLHPKTKKQLSFEFDCEK